MGGKANSRLRIRAVDLIRAWNEYAASNPRNRHNKYPSFTKKEQLIKPLGDMPWDEVENRKDEITEELRQKWEGRKEPSSRSIELAWIGLAYCYEFGVIKGLISRNPFKYMLPKRPKTGSWID